MLAILRKHKKGTGYCLNDIRGISPAFCTDKINHEDSVKPAVEGMRRLKEGMKDVVKKEVLRLLNSGMIYPLADSEWVRLVHCIPKKDGLIVVPNENNELISQWTVTGWRMCIDYMKLNKATKKDHYPLPFIVEMLERLAKNSYFCYLDSYCGFFQIPMRPKDQHKTTVTSTYAYRRMPFGLFNAPASFQRCMNAIFVEFIEDII